MSNQATVDPGAHVLTILGQRITGFAEGQGYNSSKASDNYAVVVGNLGLAAYARTRSGHQIITVTLMPTSESNSFFSAIAAADATIVGGFLVPLLKTVANSGLTTEAGSVRVTKMPDTTDTSSPNVWTFISADFVKFVGGYETTPIFKTLEELQAAIDAAPPVVAPE